MGMAWLVVESTSETAVANVLSVTLEGIGGVCSAPVQHGASKWALPLWGLAPDRDTQGTVCPHDPVLLDSATSNSTRSSPSFFDAVDIFARSPRAGAALRSSGAQGSSRASPWLKAEGCIGTMVDAGGVLTATCR